MENKSVARNSSAESITKETEDGTACLVRQQESVSMFSGPLPHPDLLKEYAKIIPDAPNRIFLMAEKQSEHRIDIEKTFIKENMQLEKLGVKFGIIIPVAGMICGTIIIITGHSAIGFTSIIATLLPSSGSYLYGLYKKQNKDTKKAEENTGEEDVVNGEQQAESVKQEE